MQTIPASNLSGSASSASTWLPSYGAFSPSSINAFNNCPRQFQLRRLEEANQTLDRETSVHTAYGNALGAGIAALFSGESLPRAQLATLLAWQGPLNLVDTKSDKSLHSAILAVSGSVDSVESVLREFTVFRMPDGRPATEVAYLINASTPELPLVFSGFLDVILQSRTTGELVPVELKSTGSRFTPTEHDYKYATQGTEYTLVTRAIAAALKLPLSAFGIQYFVYQTLQAQWHSMPFLKTVNEFRHWHTQIVSLQDQLTRFKMHSLDFPTRHTGCKEYNRVCKYFDNCTLTNDLILPSPDVFAFQRAQDRLDGKFRGSDQVNAKHNFRINLSDLLKFI